MTRDERDWASFEERIRNTMWGNTQHTTKIEDGLVFVETASHGGLVMDFAHYQKLPHDVRSYIAPGGFAEEDCNAGIVLVLARRRYQAHSPPRTALMEERVILAPCTERLWIRWATPSCPVELQA